VPHGSNRKRIPLHKLFYRESKTEKEMTIEETLEKLKDENSNIVEIKLDINKFKLKPDDEQVHSNKRY
jgi:hypothetical protein